MSQGEGYICVPCCYNCFRKYIDCYALFWVWTFIKWIDVNKVGMVWLFIFLCENIGLILWMLHIYRYYFSKFFLIDQKYFGDMVYYNLDDAKQ